MWWFSLIEILYCSQIPLHTIEIAIDHKPSHREMTSVLLSDLTSRIARPRDMITGIVYSVNNAFAILIVRDHWFLGRLNQLNTVFIWNKTKVKNVPRHVISRCRCMQQSGFKCCVLSKCSTNSWLVVSLIGLYLIWFLTKFECWDFNNGVLQKMTCVLGEMIFFLNFYLKKSSTPTWSLSTKVKCKQVLISATG